MTVSKAVELSDTDGNYRKLILFHWLSVTSVQEEYFGTGAKQNQKQTHKHLKRIKFNSCAIAPSLHI